MLKNFLASIKEDLLKQKQELKKQLEEIANKSARNQNGYEAKFPEYGDSEDENADEVATFIDTLSLEDNLETSLNNVEAALKKIEKGKYGLCEKCGQPIDIKRLKVLPQAKHCLDCHK